jgi:hypothetical protein
VGGYSFAKLHFVIKEAVFKAYYAIEKTFLDFQGVEVNIDCYLKDFSARLEDDLPGFFGSTFSMGNSKIRAAYVVPSSFCLSAILQVKRPACLVSSGDRFPLLVEIAFKHSGHRRCRSAVSPFRAGR